MASHCGAGPISALGNSTSIRHTTLTQLSNIGRLDSLDMRHYDSVLELEGVSNKLIWEYFEI